ncbi:MAG: insulinase family protein, partial [Candidatus Omnitrophota bacterium]
MKLKTTILTLFLFLFPLLTFAGQSQVSKVVLDDGLKVLIQELPSSEVISIHACVKTGSAMEGKYLGMGVSHFVEHMLFKGTLKRPVGAVAKEVKSIGGTINASTGFDYTIYTI